MRRALLLAAALLSLACPLGKRRGAPNIILAPPSAEPAPPAREPGFALAFSTNGDAAASLRAGVLRVWSDLSQPPAELALADEERSAVALAVAPGWIALGLPDGQVRLRPTSGGPAEIVRQSGPSVSALALSQDARVLVVSGAENSAEVWDLPGKTLRHTLRAHQDKPTLAVLDPRGALALTADEARAVYVWDLRTGEQRAALSGHSRPVWSAALSEDGTLALTSSADGSIRGWELPSGRERFFRVGLSWLVAARADGTRALLVQSRRALLLALPSGLALGEVPLDGISPAAPPRGAALSANALYLFDTQGELRTLPLPAEVAPLPWSE